MSMVGFDLGNKNCLVNVAVGRVIVFARDGNLKLKIRSVVCFGDKQRFFGTDGAALAVKNPENTISQIKRLIGRQFSDPELQRDLTFLPFTVTGGSDRFPLIHAQYLVKAHRFTPTQVLGMLFTHLKSVAFKSSDSDDPIADCCIGIPVYFTDLQRRLVLEAAKISGLNPLQLIHETIATALAYGSYNTDLPENDRINIVFVDVGHSSLQVCIAAFKKAQLNVLAHTFDRNLGGRDFDEVLCQHFSPKFKKEYKIDVLHNVRTCIKLRVACEKLKKVLSTKPDFVMEVEDVIDEGFEPISSSIMDKFKNIFRAKRWIIKREEFEQMSLPILERVKKPLEKALVEAGLTVDNIYAVEVVGSGSRVPAILKILTDFFGKEPLHTMNDTDCVAKGCAVQCAFLSPTYNAEDFKPYSECQPYQDFQPFQVS